MTRRASLRVVCAMVLLLGILGYAGENRRRMAFAHAQVARVETRGIHVARTLGLFAGVVAVLALAALVALAKTSSEFDAAPSPLPSAH